MKKRNLKSLVINKTTISEFNSLYIQGGAEVSERRTNCRYCNADKHTKAFMDANSCFSCPPDVCV